MWKIKDLKARARVLFKSHYWACVLAAAVFALMTYIGSGNAIAGIRDTLSQGYTSADFVGSEGAALAGTIFRGARLSLITTVIIRVCIQNPIRVGYAWFLLRCDRSGKFSEIFTSLKGIYISSGWKLFCTDLLTDLWALLFVIPGIIKAYAWRMVPYVLTENPMLSGAEARRKSAELMRGHKLHCFGMDLSFLGWYLLSAVSFGMAGVFYGDPFAKQAECELYKALRK